MHPSLKPTLTLLGALLLAPLAVLHAACGDVTLTTGASPPKAPRFQIQSGTLGDIRICHRALSAAEVASQSN